MVLNYPIIGISCVVKTNVSEYPNQDRWILRSSREYKHHDTDTERLQGPQYSHTHQVIVKNTLLDAAAVTAARAIS